MFPKGKILEKIIKFGKIEHKKVASRFNMLKIKQNHKFDTYRHFSAEIAKIEKSLQSLNNSLKEEIEFENENYEALEEVDKFLKNTGYTLIQTPDGI